MPKAKISKAERKKQQEKEMKEFLKRMGYKGTNPESVNEIPDYKTEVHKYTSNKIPGYSPKMKQNSYSGNQIAGIVTTHKSNLMPIRKDNKQAAIDAAQMRRN
jgi:hypothetical protein